MNAQTQEALNKLIENISGKLDSGIDAAHAQLPDVLQQLITFTIIKDCFAIICSLISAALFLYLCRNIVNSVRKQKECIWTDKNFHGGVELSIEGFIALLVSGVLAPCAAVVMIDYSIDLVKILIAPSVWLIEYAARLL